MKKDETNQLSPFELKGQLIKTAKESSEQILNAGRGNPNFLTTTPREGFFEWGNFAMEEAKRKFNFLDCSLGGLSTKKGLTQRLEIYLNEHDTAGSKFIEQSVSFVRDYLGYDEEDFIYEVTDAILGGEYPVPDRMLSITEKIVKHYIEIEMQTQKAFDTDFDLFATEGGAAGMSYLFNTLEKNYILSRGDCIAVGTPIFTPYLEIPKLDEYSFVDIELEATSEGNWQYSKESLDKLLNPKIKVFFLVNPSNPASVKMTDENLKYIEYIIDKRPDLIIVTDDVYGTFADNFTSIFTVCPKNTILVYSFSKYFGATGWRLGVIGVAEDNILDDMLHHMPEKIKTKLKKRYSSVTLNLETFSFIDRIVAESRIVALNHVAGLSTPAQVQMLFFSLFALMDKNDEYKKSVKKLIRDRKKSLYKHMGIVIENDNLEVGYYTIVEPAKVAEVLYGANFSEWLSKNVDEKEFLFLLASKEAIVLLPASGFGASKGGLRVSLANLNEYSYKKIGLEIKNIITDYYNRYKKLI